MKFFYLIHFKNCSRIKYITIACMLAFDCFGRLDSVSVSLAFLSLRGLHYVLLLLTDQVIQSVWIAYFFNLLFNAYFTSGFFLGSTQFRQNRMSSRKFLRCLNGVFADQIPFLTQATAIDQKLMDSQLCLLHETKTKQIILGRN